MTDAVEIDEKQFSSSLVKLQNAGPFVAALLGSGVCPYCVLRYVEASQPALYLLPSSKVASLVLKHTPLGESKDVSFTTDVCTLCLGILQHAHAHHVPALLNSITQTEYQFGPGGIEHYCLLVSLPVVETLRHSALWIYLREQHPEIKTLLADPLQADVLFLKQVIKWVYGNAVSMATGLSLQSNQTPLQLKLNFECKEAKIESLVLERVLFDNPHMRRKVTKRMRRSKHNNATMGILTKVQVEQLLPVLTRQDYKEYGLYPPPVFSPEEATPDQPTLGAMMLESWFHAPVFLSGRYVKFSREISQTPWLIDGKRINGEETSVEEEITAHILPSFRTTQVKFHSSGREDLDVRMLGDGRPFFLEIIDAKRIPRDSETYAELQEEVNRRSQVVGINSLTLSTSALFSRCMKDIGDKKKIYRCVIWVSRSLVPSDLAVLEDTRDLVIFQKTPIRVLHRRSALVRPKTIHRMHAELMTPRFVQLDLTTQAGTYIKEFVHGDRGRTKPSIGSLLGCQADILQLDVLQLIE